MSSSGAILSIQKHNNRLRLKKKSSHKGDGKAHQIRDHLIGCLHGEGGRRNTVIKLNAKKRFDVNVSIRSSCNMSVFFFVTHLITLTERIPLNINCT